MRKLPPLSAIKTFEAAARLGHFGRAADELCITLSAVSHQIRSLEAALGVTLFEKSGRSQVLTDAGRRVLYSSSLALDILAEAFVDATQPGMSGKLTISAQPELAHRFLPRIIGEFSRGYPDLNLHLMVHDSDTSEINPAADITLLYAMGNEDWRRYWITPFQAIDFFPVCHPSLFDAVSGRMRAQDLAQYCLLHDDTNGKTWASWLGAHSRQFVLPRRNIYFSHTGLAIEAALQGVGICLADSLTAGEELKSGKLIRPLEGTIPALGNYFLVTEKRKHEDPRIAAFMRFGGLTRYLVESNSTIPENMSIVQSTAQK